MVALLAGREAAYTTAPTLLIIPASYRKIRKAPRYHIQCHAAPLSLITYTHNLYGIQIYCNLKHN